MKQTIPFRNFGGLFRVDQRTAQRRVMAAMLVIFAGLSVQYSFKVLQPRDDGLTRSAILRWTPQIQALGQGVDISRAYNYPNPPIMALILRPFTELPPLAGALAWFYVKVAMALLAMFWVFRMLDTPRTPFPPWAQVLAAALSLRPILSDLSHGNVNILILFLIVGSLHAYHVRRDFLAGVVLALAIACKLTPALLIGYFLWKGAWRTLAGCAVGLVSFFLLVPGLALGFEYNWLLLTGWVEVMVLPFVQGGVVTSEHHNQSLPGLIYRLFTYSPSFTDYVHDRYVALEYHNVLNLSVGTAGWIIKGFMGAFAVLVVWLCRNPTRDRRGWPLPAEYALIVLGMLLFSERTWKHHAVTLVLPFAVICYALATAELSRLMRRGLIASLALSAAMMSSTSSGLFGERGADLTQTYGGFTMAFAVLTTATAALLWHAKSVRPPAESIT